MLSPARISGSWTAHMECISLVPVMECCCCKHAQAHKCLRYEHSLACDFAICSSKLLTFYFETHNAWLKWTSLCHYDLTGMSFTLEMIESCAAFLRYRLSSNVSSLKLRNQTSQKVITSLLAFSSCLLLSSALCFPLHPWYSSVSVHLCLLHSWFDPAFVNEC